MYGFILICYGCVTKSTFVIINDERTLDSLGIKEEVVSNRTYSPCDDPLFYLPDTLHPFLTPKKEIRVLFHIMNNSRGDGNFNKTEASKFFKNLMDGANDHLKNNLKMNLPEGHNIPVYPINYAYKKALVPEDEDGDGILHHYDDALYFFVNKGRNRNNYQRGVISKYNVGEDSVINVYVMPHHPDSVASETYKVTNAGIALGNSVKIAGIYETDGEPWQFQSLLNHEIGHVLGLRHSWEKYDGCDDTPEHPNCYGRTDVPPCDGLISNNMMDYNNSQRALSPCQIGTIHRNLNREYSSQRKLIIKNWCKLDTSFTIKIEDSVEWKGSKDLLHSISVENGGVLSINCRISMPENAEIRVKAGGKLILDGARIHNDCGLNWRGIYIEKKGNQQGQVNYQGDVLIENTEVVNKVVKGD